MKDNVIDVQPGYLIGALYGVIGRKAYQLWESPVAICQIRLAWVVERKTTAYPWGSHSRDLDPRLDLCVVVAMETGWLRPVILNSAHHNFWKGPASSLAATSLEDVRRGTLITLHNITVVYCISCS